MGNKNIVKDKELKKEAQQIEKEMKDLMLKIENLKAKLGKIEEAPKEEAK